MADGLKDCHKFFSSVSKKAKTLGRCRQMIRFFSCFQTVLTGILITIGIVLFSPAAGTAASGHPDVFQQGLMYFDSGNFKDAYRLFLKAFKADPGDLNINFYLGRAAFESGNYEMALMAFERILIAQPESVRIKLEMARTFHRLGLRDSARRYFEDGNLSQAIIHWEKVERLAPDYASVREYLVNAYKFVGVELYSQNKLQEAVDTWQKALRLQPGNDEIARYIRRTENEIRKLHELSYDEN